MVLDWFGRSVDSLGGLGWLVGGLGCYCGGLGWFHGPSTKDPKIPK